MNKYIFITLSITNVGGAEQYIYNKTRFLKDKGYRVFVFSSLNRPILIRGLSEYRKYIIPALMYSPSFYSKKNIEMVISEITNLIDIKENDKLFIESHNICQGLWGELLAQKINGKNVIFNLQEKHMYSRSEKDYLWFKLKRKELLGITKDSVSQMFKKDIPCRKWMKFSASCNNVVEDVEDVFSSKLDKKAKYTFGSIGRLEKEFVPHLVDTLIAYCTLHSDENYNLVFIGGSSEVGIEDAIRKKIKVVDNINLIITGFLYPIPRTLINNVDLFISTAGSATVSYKEKAKTIKVHPITAEPTQIMGYTYDSITECTMFDVISNTSLIEQIDLALSGISIKYPDDNNYYEDRMHFAYLEQLMVFEKSTNNNNYFSIYNVKPIFNAKSVMYCLLGKTFGDEKMQFVLEQLRKSKIAKKVFK